jgi:DNA-binding MarR family transcriptional regulator
MSTAPDYLKGKPMTATLLAKHDKELRQALKQCGINDPSGIDLFRLLNASAHLLEALAEHDLQASGLSFPRLWLLVWLRVEELRGNAQGVSPSGLSRFQHVSKNTVSSLLRSLEEQGLIERAVCDQDKRKFNIRLSPAGRKLVCAVLPEHGDSVIRLFACLSPSALP